jgi:hypothetical protein
LVPVLLWAIFSDRTSRAMTWLFAEVAKVGSTLRKPTAKANEKTSARRVRGEIIIAVPSSFHLPFNFVQLFCHLLAPMQRCTTQAK